MNLEEVLFYFDSVVPFICFYTEIIQCIVRDSVLAWVEDCSRVTPAFCGGKQLSLPVLQSMERPLCASVLKSLVKKFSYVSADVFDVAMGSCLE